MAMDWKKSFNTPLTPEESRMYNQWLIETSMATGRNLSMDEYDYDMRGWWKENGQVSENGHRTDTYKKPNHPTFSKGSKYSGKDGYVGGDWTENGDGTWTFEASQTNLDVFGEDRLRAYFSKYEKGNTLKVKAKKKLEDLFNGL